jgi:hypothetical protein
MCNCANENIATTPCKHHNCMSLQGWLPSALHMPAGAPLEISILHHIASAKVRDSSIRSAEARLRRTWACGHKSRGACTAPFGSECDVRIDPCGASKRFLIALDTARTKLTRFYWVVIGSQQTGWRRPAAAVCSSACDTSVRPVHAACAPGTQRIACNCVCDQVQA